MSGVFDKAIQEAHDLGAEPSGDEVTQLEILRYSIFTAASGLQRRQYEIDGFAAGFNRTKRAYATDQIAKGVDRSDEIELIEGAVFWFERINAAATEAIGHLRRLAGEDGENPRPEVVTAVESMSAKVVEQLTSLYGGKGANPSGAPAPVDPSAAHRPGTYL